MKQKNQVVRLDVINYLNLVKIIYLLFFRPLTYYLFHKLKLNEEVRYLVDNDLLKDKVKLGYKIQDKEVKISVNSKFYSFDQLNNLQMNIDTVNVGAIIGDTLSDTFKDIINDIKNNYNVLLNARRPAIAYPDLDYHIFLDCSFEERSKRKMIMNNETLENTEDKLLKRDEKEVNSGFWNKYDFITSIDTTNLTKEEVFSQVLNSINFLEPIKNLNVRLGNLTLVLGSYKCNKNCPYCIAKNNMKFYDYDDKLGSLGDIFNELLINNIHFNRFVLSGNGEPSFYDYESLKIIRDNLVKYRDLFDKIRVHSSGNIFFNEDKFNLFNDKMLSTEFEVLRVDLDGSLDSKILGYNNNYLDSPLFNRANTVKCDIAFTDYLDINNLKTRLYDFLDKHDSIKKVRFKKLLVGEDSNTVFGVWTKKYSLSDDKIKEIIDELGLVRTNRGYEGLDGRIVYKPNGIYDRDIFINNGCMQHYNGEVFSAKELVKKYNGRVL